MKLFEQLPRKIYAETKIRIFILALRTKSQRANSYTNLIKCLYISEQLY